MIVPPPAADLEPAQEPPTFSIVVPAYQAAGTVGEAVASACAQTWPAHEIIVVDDGSTDDIERALTPFADRIKLIRKRNGGNASALNAGLAVASAAFLTILDADDVYHPRRLEALAGLAVQRPDLDLITTDARFIVGGEAVGTFYENNPFCVDDQRVGIIESCFVGGWPAIRVQRLRLVGGFDEQQRTSVDWDCWMRVILSGGAAGLVDEPYYDYRIEGKGLTSNRVASLWDRVRLLEKAAKHPTLTGSERVALERALGRRRAKATVAETRAVLSGEIPRHRLLALGSSRGLRPRVRAGVALALAAPPLARRLLPVDVPPEERFVPRA